MSKTLKITIDPVGNDGRYETNISLYGDYMRTPKKKEGPKHKGVPDLLYETETEFSFKDSVVSWVQSISVDSFMEPIGMNIEQFFADFGDRASEIDYLQDLVNELTDADVKLSYDIDTRDQVLTIKMETQSFWNAFLKQTDPRLVRVDGVPFKMYIPYWCMVAQEEDWNHDITETFLATLAEGENPVIMDMIKAEQAVNTFYHSMDEKPWEHQHQQDTMWGKIWVKLIDANTLTLSTEKLKAMDISHDDLEAVIIEIIQAFGEYQLIFDKGEYYALDIG